MCPVENQHQVRLAKQHLACPAMKRTRLFVWKWHWSGFIYLNGSPRHCFTCLFMQKQMSARVLMPPPRALPSRNRSVEKIEVSTSSNTSNSRSGPSTNNWGSLNSRVDHNSNLSSNSDAHKPRRKRRPKKKKQVWLNLLFNFCASDWSIFLLEQWRAHKLIKLSFRMYFLLFDIIHSQKLSGSFLVLFKT